MNINFYFISLFDFNRNRLYSYWSKFSASSEYSHKEFFKYNRKLIEENIELGLVDEEKIDKDKLEKIKSKKEKDNKEE